MFIEPNGFECEGKKVLLLGRFFGEKGCEFKMRSFDCGWKRVKNFKILYKSLDIKCFMLFSLQTKFPQKLISNNFWRRSKKSIPGS